MNSSASNSTDSADPPPKPSYRDLPPLETGGVVARGGFCFQDHIAAGYCLQMLETPSLLEVWCEAQDDVTLVWVKNDKEEFEFVQVKDLQFGSFWSIAKLCERKNNKEDIGTSIIERSLAYDR